MNSLEKVFSFVWVASFLFIAPHLYADKLDSVAEKARNATGKENITCSLNGDSKDVIAISKATGELKKQTVLNIIPDNYSTRIYFLKNDDLIIESSPDLMSKFDKNSRGTGNTDKDNDCEREKTFDNFNYKGKLPCPPVFLDLQGQDDIVRNFNGYLRVHQSVTIVDSVLIRLSVMPENSRTEINLVNSIVFSLICTGSKARNGSLNINMKNCTVVSYCDERSPLYLCGLINMNISNSILFSPGDLFLVTLPKKKLNLKDSVLSGRKSLCVLLGNDQKNKGKSFTDMKSLKKVMSISCDKNTVVADPMFEEDPDLDLNLTICPISNLKLKDASPAKKLNAGVNLSEENFPVPPDKEKAKQGE